MMIKEATATYGVSRAKIHRLISRGRLTAMEDPRDERVKLLSKEDLDALFQLGAEERSQVRYGTEQQVNYVTEQAVGRITPDGAARMDAVRERIAASGVKLPDSTRIIREERDRRSQYLYETAAGIDAGPGDESALR